MGFSQPDYQVERHLRRNERVRSLVLARDSRDAALLVLIVLQRLHLDWSRCGRERPATRAEDLRTYK